VPAAIVVGISSDIGRELASRLVADGWTVSGTFRQKANVRGLPPSVSVTPCDLTSRQSIDSAVEALRRESVAWDVLVLAAGTVEPVGAFWDCDSNEWEESIQANALGPLRIVRALYPTRSRIGTPGIVFFSGAGSNGPAPSYSAYCASKILLIKMCELLDSETPDASIFIVGPGMVRTKIHDPTLRSPERSGLNYQKVVDFLASPGLGTSHDDIYACVKWCISAGKQVVGGRNISLVNDAWRSGGKGLAQALERDPALYKLRRFGNERRIAEDKV
jgi:NAD(P)-dependent dehydrogenase (short-subunit alcohol dehydrogenase family)